MADDNGNILTITVADPGSDTRAIETAWIARALSLASQVIRSKGGTQTSGTITAEQGKVLGAWTYSPTAAA